MIRPELGIAASNLSLALRHPRWWWAFLEGGRRGLIRQMMVESLGDIHGRPAISAFNELATRRGVSVFSQLGATQEYLYDVVRWLKPDVVVETGVYRGLSSAFMLAAMRENGRGRLFSIDLPSAEYTIPGTRKRDTSPLTTSEQPGFAIPEELKSRWTLVLGDVRVKLPPLLKELGSIDMFYHDSEHTEEIMGWEYGLAWATLRPGGLLTTDDYTWNRAFDSFVETHQVTAVLKLGNRLGLALKPG